VAVEALETLSGAPGIRAAVASVLAGMEENYNFVRQAAKEVLGGNTSFLKKIHRHQSRGLSGLAGSDLASGVVSIGSETSTGSESSSSEDESDGELGARSMDEGGLVKGGQNQKRRLERARIEHEAAEVKKAEEERLRDFQNIVSLQEQPAAGGGNAESSSLLALRKEVREASRVFAFLSLVHVPDFREEETEHVDVRGKEGLLDLNVEDLGLDREFSGDMMMIMKKAFGAPARVTHASVDGYQSIGFYAWQTCCSHSHILPLYLAAGPNLFIVPRMPLVPAQAFLDNHAAVNDRMQKELLTMQVCLQVAWALEYLHGEGVLHLDVNPANVVIRDTTNGGMQQQPQLFDEEYSGYGTPKTPGGSQLHTRPFLTAWAMLADLGLASRARDSHTSIDVYSYKDTSKQPQRFGGTPQFWAPEQILPGNTFWGQLACPRDCPIQIEAPIIDQVDTWGWATTTIRFFGCTRLLWDFGYSAFVEWLKSEESQERLPTGAGLLLSTCLRIQPSARPSCAKISHSMSELLQLQTSVAGYKVDKFQPAIEPRQLVPFVRSQQYVCSSLLDKTDAQCRGSCSLLGKVLRVFGPFEEALTVTLDALEMKKMSLADGKTSSSATADAELARYLAAAGTAHSKLGHVMQAAKFYEMALDTYNRSLVPNHPSIAALLNNYGVLYEHKGEYDKAVAMHEQALSMRTQVLGEWHTDVSVSLNNLAILHRRIGNYKQAIPLYEKSLAIRQRSLGETHVAVAVSLNNLGQCYRHMGEPLKALPMHEQSLKVFEQALGSGHPNVSAALNNLVALLEELGRYDEALPLYERRMAGEEQQTSSATPRARRV